MEGINKLMDGGHRAFLEFYTDLVSVGFSLLRWTLNRICDILMRFIIFALFSARILPVVVLYLEELQIDSIDTRH